MSRALLSCACFSYSLACKLQQRHELHASTLSDSISQILNSFKRAWAARASSSIWCMLQQQHVVHTSEVRWSAFSVTAWQSHDFVVSPAAGRSQTCVEKGMPAIDAYMMPHRTHLSSNVHPCIPWFSNPVLCRCYFAVPSLACGNWPLCLLRLLQCVVGVDG